MTTDLWAAWRGPAPAALTPHPLARRSLVLGLIGLIGFFCLLIPVLLSPFAWYYGAVARRDMIGEPGRWAASGDAKTGMICGIIGTVLLALAIVIGTLVVGSLALLLTFEGGYSA